MYTLIDMTLGQNNFRNFGNVWGCAKYFFEYVDMHSKIYLIWNS